MKKLADAISVGQVKSVSGEMGLNRVIVCVTKSWRGENTEFIVIHTYASGCGVDFQEGESYLIYAKTDSNTRLSTEVCFGTGSIRLAKDDLRHLGKPFFERVPVTEVKK